MVHAGRGDRARRRAHERTLRVTSAVVPLPPSVHDAQLPWWTADGSSLVLSARSTDFPGMQIVRVRPDGSGFACLTCAIAPGDPPLMKPIPLPDGRRILVRVGNQSPVTNGRHAVLECTPNVESCAGARLVPIEIPIDAAVVQPQREFRAAPDGHHVAFTQVRKDVSGDPVFVASVAELRRAGDHYRLAQVRAVSTRGELKDFTPDGKHVVISAFVEGPEAANPDDLEVDLRTGKVTRLTYYPDYEEPAEQSPRSGLWAIGSARTAKIFEPLARIRRPNLFANSLAPLTFAFFLRYRDELLEPWVIDARAEQRGLLGTRLNPDSPAAGWEGRMIPNWNPDGRRVAYWETRTASAAGASDAGTRIVVDTLPGAPVGRAPRSTVVPTARWAPRVAGFTPPDPALPRSRRGRASGRVVVRATTTGTTVDIAVSYRHFADEPGHVLDGTEHVTNTGGMFGSLTYAADVRLSGHQRGRLRAVDVHGTVAGFVGTIDSTLDGVPMHLDLATGPSSVAAG